jgi:hypothetical protein
MTFYWWTEYDYYFRNLGNYQNYLNFFINGTQLEHF